MIKLDDFSLLIFDIIKIIEDEEDVYHCKPFYKTIHSFVCSNKNSSFVNLFSKYKATLSKCAKYNHDKESIIFACERLIREGKITVDFSPSGKVFYTTKNISQEDKRFFGMSISRQYNLEFLESLANWNIHLGHGGKIFGTYECKDGFIFEAQSRGEIKLIKKLDSNSYYKYIRGQNLSIQYVDDKGKINKYSPDFVVLTNKGHIALIERKPLYLMAEHSNVEKYYALTEYAKENGFLCEMWDSNKRSFRNLLYKSISPRISKLFLRRMKLNGFYDYDDFTFDTKGMSNKERDEFKTNLAALSLQYGCWWEESVRKHFHQFKIVKCDKNHSCNAIYAFRNKFCF